MNSKQQITSSLLLILAAIAPGCNRSVQECPLNLKPDERVVYGTGLSPYVRKVRVILNEKNIRYTHNDVLPTKVLVATNQPIPADFKEASPLGKIPAYREKNWTIADSGVIAQYLERAYSKPILFPEEAKLYAETLWFEKYGDEVLGPVILNIFRERVTKPKILKQETDNKIIEQSLKKLPALFDYLEASLGKKEWIAGDQFTVADITLASHIVNLQLAGEKIDEEKWPRFAAYIDKILKRDSFKKVL